MVLFAARRLSSKNLRGLSPNNGQVLAKGSKQASSSEDSESRKESWDVLHSVKGMRKTATGRYVKDEATDDSGGGEN